MKLGLMAGVSGSSTSGWLLPGRLISSFSLVILDPTSDTNLQHGRGRGLSAYLKSNSDSLQ